MARLKEREQVGSDRRASLANRILKDFLGGVEERESLVLFVQSEKKRLRADVEARTYDANRSEFFSL